MESSTVRPWSPLSAEAYAALALEAHALLADVPLPSGPREATMLEVRRVAEAAARRGGGGRVVSGLFALRGVLGAWLGLDEVPSGPASGVAGRVPEPIRAASLVPPGTMDGPFRVLYVLPSEALSETRNATVEAWLVWGLRPVAGGHDLVFAVHVRPTGPLTRPYLALIAPFRRFLVYPRLLRALHDAWVREDG